MCLLLVQIGEIILYIYIMTSIITKNNSNRVFINRSANFVGFLVFLSAVVRGRGCLEAVLADWGRLRG